MPHTIQTDSSGNIFITGYVGPDADFDPGPGIAIKSSNPGRDAFLAKYDTNGNYLWAVVVGNPETGTLTSDDPRYEEGMDLTIDSDGNVYFTGVFDGTIDSDQSDGEDSGDTYVSKNNSRDCFVAEYSSSGSYISGFVIGGDGREHCHGIRTGKNGDIYIGGFFTGTADFDPGAGVFNLTASGTLFDIFLAKYDKNANLVFAKSTGSLGADQIRPGAFEIDGNDNLYIAGDFSNTVDFDFGTNTANLTANGVANGAGDIFFAKYDKDGNYVWAKGIGGTGGDAAHRIDIDKAGNVWIAGWFGGTVNFDPGTNIAEFTAKGSVADIFLAKYDNSGNYQWAKTIGGNVTETQMAAGLDVTDEGISLITGKFGGSALFAEGVELTAAGSDSFIAKYDTDGKNVDFGCNSDVDLNDVITALRIMSGIDAAPGLCLNDINGDRKIGLEEVIYILQKVAGIR